MNATKAVRNCPRCTQLSWDLKDAHRKVRRRWFKTRRLWIRYGARPDDLAVLDARWADYARRSWAVAQIDACPHHPQLIPLTPVRPGEHVSEPAKLGNPGDNGDLDAIRDSALSDFLNLQEDAFAWRPLEYDLLGDLTEHQQTATAFQLVNDKESEDRIWIEDLDEEDWRRIHAFCEGEPRWYIEPEDRYAAMHFLQKWRMGDTRDDTRDHPARDRLAALRRRHQGAQVIADLHERWKRSAYQGYSWDAPNSEIAESDSYTYTFEEWLEKWAPDAIPDVEHALLMAERPPLEPVLRFFHPRIATDPKQVGWEHDRDGFPTRPRPTRAIWKIYQDEPLSDLEVVLLKNDARAQFQARFGEPPDQVYVNTNYVEIELVEGAASELPDHLMEMPEEAYAE